MPQVRQIQLAEELCSAAEQKLGHKFQSVEQLVEFVLRELVQDSTSSLDENEQRIVEERLRELGYI